MDSGHVTCIVDMLSRMNYLDMAEKIFESYQSLTTIATLMAFLGGCRHSHDVKRGDFEGIYKIPGKSTVDIGGILHSFYVEDEQHPDVEEIYKYMEMLNRNIYVMMSLLLL